MRNRSPVYSPELELDDLRRDRWETQRQGADQLGQAFGQAPLTLANLQRGEEDRALKMKTAQAALANQAEDQSFQREDQARKRSDLAIADKKTALSAEVGADLAKGRTLNDRAPPPKPLPEGVEGPLNAPDIKDIPADYAAEFGKQDLAKRGAESIIGQRGNKHQEALDLMELKRQGIISADEYHKGILAYKNKTAAAAGGHANIAQQRLDLERDKFGLQQKREARLGEMKDIPPQFLKELSSFQEINDQVDNLRQEMADHEIDTGPLVGFMTKLGQWTHVRGVDEAAASAMQAQIVNTAISAFAGKTVTPHELERVMQTMPSSLDAEEVWNRLLDHVQYINSMKHNSLVDTLAGSPGRGYVEDTYGHRDNAGKKTFDPTARRPSSVATPDKANPNLGSALPPRRTDGSESPRAYAKRLIDSGVPPAQAIAAAKGQ